MGKIINKVQTDFKKVQKTIEQEGEILLDKIKTAATKAANNKNVVEKRKQIEDLVETQYKKFEPKIDKIYQDLKVKAEKYGVNVDKIENGVINTTQRAVHRLKLDRMTTAKTDLGAKKADANARKTGAQSSKAAKKKG